MALSAIRCSFTQIRKGRSVQSRAAFGNALSGALVIQPEAL
ncbi:hypothetical protein AEST_17020 [Alishewanella aestuarii B11]|uniref:Uncharacterized protein n=1 Tax=Alishewanella aestuarii B11 TaxID=1197174 RepID=J1Q2S6_9ALTE|nr:hypothetical protein AEST_17020 [Alishewanella aestuarii B11]